ncbi:MAG: ornithine carbamoyltransferase [Deltaproteobacteria bacterium]|nr:ornithine carbamoyltransferase [Deltaproteobacteria bacterium]
MKRDLVTILDLGRDEILGLIERAISLKNEQSRHAPLAFKTLALIFEKPSTRTRVSFEVAMYQLGGNVIFLTKDVTQMSRKEPTRDTARVLSRYVDGIVMRTYSHSLIEEMARFSSVPVINGLSERYHPCQVLSDLMTIKEYKGEIEGLKVAWIGDGNNVANSWINAAIRLDFTLHLACPNGYGPKGDVLERAKERRNIILTNDPISAIRDAHVVNTDVWVSMGQEEEASKKRQAFSSYQLNEELLSYARDDVIVMHCLPAHRGEEITDGVIEGPHSVVFEQAENKLHLHKAVLEAFLK